MAWRERLTTLPVTRRQVFTGAALGGGLVVAWRLWPRSYDPPLEPAPGETGFGAWLTVARDGVVTVAVPQLEMGQGVTTLLPQVVAMEMGADWRQVAVIPAPPSGAQPNVPLAGKWKPLWARLPALANAQRFASETRFIATADGTSLAAYETPAREAGATARALMAMAAADRWNVAWEECDVAQGIVSHGNNRATFGELAEDAAGFDPPDPPPLRTEAPLDAPEDAVVLGETGASTRYPRLDLPAKVDGSFLFAGDVRLPGMVHASIRHGPMGLPELTGFDPALAARVPGVITLVTSRRWIAAVAESWWQAEQALAAMRPRFSGPKAVDHGTIGERLDAGLATGEAHRITTRGEPDAALADPEFVRRYDIGPAVHNAIETASATAHFADGKLELWIASQAPEAARRAAAKAIGLSDGDVVLYPMGAGGSFDARLERQHAIEAAQIAYEIGRPVQLTWPRREEAKTLPPRTPLAIRLTAALAEEGLPAAWRARVACPATVREFGNRLFDNSTPEAAIREAAGEADPLALEGAMSPYTIPAVAIDHVPVTLDLPTGRLRGNAPAYTAFANECFVDELARAAGRDPFLYRMAMLGADGRMADVLRRATRFGGWDGGGEGSGQGLAMVRMEGPGGESEDAGFIACVAQARLGAGGVQVERLTAVVDIGRIVNRDLARQQIEGGLIFGLSLATGSSPEWVAGRPEPASLRDMGLPTLASMPEIALDFVESEAAPFDPGELGVAVAPPAIANALFAATGLRFRRLPLLSEGL
ncbi:molybdopterin cofactor-binding domain-containing protein [Qipengyuania sp. MTN3-11]|uniref:xanthine dehydrogenase family protein molybdopterin-binding subunit n=1 Tax=Qipengyuania sp. MTN3-11 TaxID=3056557 RepID=UPI0036F3148A